MSPFPRPASSQLTTSAPLLLTLLVADMKCAPEVDADAVPTAKTRQIAATRATSASEDFLSDNKMLPPLLPASRHPSGASLKASLSKSGGFCAGIRARLPAAPRTVRKLR